MNTIEALIATLKKAKDELEKAIKPGPTLDYTQINKKPDHAAIEAAAPTIDYGGNRMVAPKWQGAAERAASVRAKLDAEAKEPAIDTINRRQKINKNVNESYTGGANSSKDSLTMSKKEPHDDPKHEEKEKAKATKIKEEAEDILDLHKDESCIKANSNGQWYLEKTKETVNEFIARGGKITKVPTPKKESPDKDVKVTAGTPVDAHKKGGPINLKKEEDSNIEKSNEIKPFGQNVYDAKANIKRKEKRLGEEVASAGKNVAVHPFTTIGSSIQATHEAKMDKEMKAKTKASTRTMKDMSPEELKAIRDRGNKN